MLLRIRKSRPVFFKRKFADETLNMELILELVGFIRFMVAS